MLFSGWFYSARKKKVEFDIYENYEVVAKFSLKCTPYIFHMKKWTNDFDFFATLLLDKFENYCPEFGALTHVHLPDGGLKIIRKLSQERIINILKYAAVEVFNCIEEIIYVQCNSLLDYAIYHKNIDKHSTYEEYIHLVACQCLIHSNFRDPNTHFETVDLEMDYKPNVLKKIIEIF